jgi:threonine dehydrogenase-like Zn-dependent dehydrogenase
VFRLGSIGQMAARIALHRGASQVFGIDLVDERLEMAQRHGVHTLDAREHDGIPETLRGLTDGRGPDAVIDAAGMEAHGAPVARFAQQLAGMLPGPAARVKLSPQGGPASSRGL